MSDILTGRVLTVGLCIWTALHFNIPVDGKDLAQLPCVRARIYYSRLVQQARWIVVTLLVPEIVIYSAWQQRQEVKQITAMTQKAQARAKVNGDGPAFDWTEAHSWYLVMGGFYFDTDTKQPYIPRSPELILTSKAMHLLTSTSPPLLPEIVEGAVPGHTKVSRIMEWIAVLQVILQIAVCIAQSRSGLAISPLQINTLGHILCAFAIYTYWSRKPRGVEVRTRIEARWSDPLCAYLSMCMSKKFWLGSSPPNIVQLFPILRSIDGLQGAAPRDAGKDAASGDEKTSAVLDDDDLQRKDEPTPPPSPDTLNSEKGGTSLHSFLTKKATSVTEAARPLDIAVKASKKRDFRCLLDEWYRINPMVDTTRFKDMMLPILKNHFRPAALDSRDETNLACVNLALQYLSFWSDNVVTSTSSSPDGPDHINKGARVRRDWTVPPYAPEGLKTLCVSDGYSLEKSSLWYLGLVLPATTVALLTVCSGSLHASAWLYHFPTPIEAMLWRISSIIITSAEIFAVLDGITVAISSHFTDRIVCGACDDGEPWVSYEVRNAMWLPQWMRTLTKPFTTWRRHVLEYVDGLHGQRQASDSKPHHSILVKLPVWGLLTLFIGSRMFVIVEAIISSRSLSTTAHGGPEWW